MNDILLALAFVGTVAAPAIVAAIPFKESPEEAEKSGHPLMPLLSAAKRNAPAAASQG